MSTHKSLFYDNYGTRVRIHYIDPETCSIAPLADAGRLLEAAIAEYQTARADRDAAAADLERFADDSRAQAHEAGAEGKKLDKGKLRKKRQALIERAEDTELDYVASLANLPRVHTAYLATLVEHAPALADHAREEAKSAMASLATAVGVIRRAGASLTDSLSLMGALPGVVDGDEFNPRPMRARREGSDEFILSSVPEVHLDAARESLGGALGFADRILKDLAKQQKAARLQDEVDDAPDLEDDDEDDLDDDETDYS